MPQHAAIPKRTCRVWRAPGSLWQVCFAGSVYAIPAMIPDRVGPRTWAAAVCSKSARSAVPGAKQWTPVAVSPLEGIASTVAAAVAPATAQLDVLRALVAPLSS